MARTRTIIATASACTLLLVGLSAPGVASAQSTSTSITYAECQQLLSPSTFNEYQKEQERTWQRLNSRTSTQYRGLSLWLVEYQAFKALQRAEHDQFRVMTRDCHILQQNMRRTTRRSSGIVYALSANTGFRGLQLVALQYPGNTTIVPTSAVPTSTLGLQGASRQANYGENPPTRRSIIWQARENERYRRLF